MPMVALLRRAGITNGVEDGLLCFPHTYFNFLVVDSNPQKGPGSRDGRELHTVGEVIYHQILT